MSLSGLLRRRGCPPTWLRGGALGGAHRPLSSPVDGTDADAERGAPGGCELELLNEEVAAERVGSRTEAAAALAWFLINVFRHGAEPAGSQRQRRTQPLPSNHEP